MTRPLSTRDRDPVVGLRRLRHALRDVPAARPAARRVRAHRRRRRGAPPDRHGAGRRAALPVGPGRRSARRCARHAEARGLRDRRRQPEPVPGPRLQARLDHPPRRGRAPQGDRPPARVRGDRARARLDRAVAVVRRRHQLPRPGRPARAPARGCSTAWPSCMRRCRRRRSCWSSTSRSSRRSTRPTSPTGGRRCSPARSWASGRRCSSTSATTCRAPTSSRSSPSSRDEGRLGGFHFNNRKYADDDLIVGSVNPFELFLIFFELRRRPLPRLTIDQAHNVEAKVEAMVLSVVNLQEAYAKALLVDREALRRGAGRG